MPHDKPSSAEIEELIRGFFARRRTEPRLTAAQFVAEHPEGGAQLRTEIEAALRTAEGGGTILQASRAEPTAAVEGEHTLSQAERTQMQSEEAAATVTPTGPAPRPGGGRLIDRRYEIVRVLGEGGFGKVYQVRDTLHQGELRALKTILPAHSAKPAFESRFRNEILVLRALAHGGIPQIHNDGKTDEGEFYYTMAYVDGPTLADVLKKEGALSPDRVVRLVRQMLSILEYAHDKGVVHRDLKPANVMLVNAGTPAEQVKILDFGIAKVLRAEGELEGAQTMHTMAGMGTPHYMSPEQIRGKDVDPRSDVYALGIMIYQMCSGKLPFGGKTDLEIATARLEHTPKPLTQEQAPDWLRAAVMQLLERDREKRPTTREVHQRFERLAGGQRRILRSLRWTAAGVLVLALGMAWMLWSSSGGGVSQAGVLPGPAPGPGPSAAPAITLSEPREGAHLPSASVPVSGTSQAAVVEIDGEQVTVGPDSTFRHVVELPENAASTIVTSTGTGAPLEVNVVVDTRRPELACDLGPELTASPRVQLDGHVRDEAPGILVPESVLLDGEPLELDADGAFTRTLELTGEGEHRFQVVAADRAGNASAWSGAVTLDTRSPRIALDETPPLKTERARLVLRGRIDDAHPAALRLAHGGADDELALANGAFDHEVELALGVNELSLVATDAAGNMSEPLVVTVRRELLPVRVTDTSPAPGATFPPDRAQVTVSGSADRALAWVEVNGVRAQLDDERRFHADVPLVDGENRIEIVPYDTESMAGEKHVLTLERVPLKLPAAARAANGAEITADGRPLRVVHEKSGIPLLLVEAGDTRFYLGETEVTRAQLERIAGGTRPAPSDADHPAISVTFDEAQRVCALGGLRLPTVEEWDLAARGPEGREYPWGGEWRDGIANVGSIAAVSAGSHPDDRAWCGALDMAGNVSEWCTSAGQRALRGGSWSSDAESCKLSRSRSAPKGGSDYVGFRVVLDAP